MTLAEAFWCWHKLYLSRYRKDGGAEMARLFHREILPRLGDVALVDLKRGDIVAVVDVFVLRDTPRQGKVALASLRQLFRFCIEREYLDQDPTQFVSKRLLGRETYRDRFLRDDEIKILASRLPQSGLKPSTRYALWLMLSTLCRVGELSRARWTHLDFREGLWRIPATDTKNGREHRIFLSGFARRAFLTLKDCQPDSDWCFPMRGHLGQPIGEKSITKQVADRQTLQPQSKRTGHTQSLVLPGGRWTPHDLRRTGATMMGDLGVSSEVIEKCLNHIERDRIKRTYQHARLENEQRAAWAMLGQQLENLVGNRPFQPLTKGPGSSALRNQ